MSERHGMREMEEGEGCHLAAKLRTSKADVYTMRHTPSNGTSAPDWSLSGNKPRVGSASGLSSCRRSMTAAMASRSFVDAPKPRSHAAARAKSWVFKACRRSFASVGKLAWKVDVDGVDAGEGRGGVLTFCCCGGGGDGDGDEGLAVKVGDVADAGAGAGAGASAGDGREGALRTAPGLQFDFLYGL